MKKLLFLLFAICIIQTSFSQFILDDGDGISNIVDVDDDNDGIPDVIEFCGIGATSFSCVGSNPMADNDADLILNFMDADYCILNSFGVCISLDNDNDGIINSHDLDSDNDGISDIVEAGGVDANGDGRVDVFIDIDFDGLADLYDFSVGGIAIANEDKDNDGIANALDLDSDGDGILDIQESGIGVYDTNLDGVISSLDLNGADANHNGWANALDNNTNTHLTLLNSDFISLPNMYDVDSDQDGIVDNIEGQPTIGYVPPSNNDADNDGIDDTYDNNDIFFGGNPFNGVNATNSDGTDVRDYIDTNSDNDAHTDYVEGYDTNDDLIPEVSYSLLDSDNDGLDNAFDIDGSSVVNTGGATNGDIPSDFPNLHGTPQRDWREFFNHKPIAVNDVETVFAGIIGNIFDVQNNDIDVDLHHLVTTIISFPSMGTASVLNNDSILYTPFPSSCGIDTIVYQICDISISSKCDTALIIINILPLDSDNDGIANTVEGLTLDTDSDGIRNYLDIDSDNDCIRDSIEVGISLSCSSTAVDTDNDFIPDYLDLDSDNDGIADIIESGYGIFDFNGDGTAEIISAYDLNSNGMQDVLENRLPNNSDGDALPSFRDLDSDNDGIADIIEANRTSFDSNHNGFINFLDVNGTDSDLDGIPNSIDGLVGFGYLNHTIANLDFDKDNVLNFLDLDSDNDGFTDVIEAGWHSLDTNENGVMDGVDADNDGIIDNTLMDSNASYGANINTQDDINLDNDGDGLYDFNDLDADNDGFADVVEAGFGAADGNNDGVITDVDFDFDGIPNFSLLDSNMSFGANINTQDELFQDADNDGSFDSEDLDADNDGMADVVEIGLGAIDIDNNGVIDGTDTDNDGIINITPLDNNNSYGANLNTQDESVHSADGGSLNTEDIDADGDGVNDLIEAGFGNLDLDNDGTIDGTDTDGDGLVNVNDIDNNSIYGGTINSQNEQDWDPDHDGFLNNVDGNSDNEDGNDAIEYNNGSDCDLNTIPDYLDPIPCGINVPEAFSPNNDGINDVFQIQGLVTSLYPDYQCTIYNRWGNEVARLNSTSPTWNGQLAIAGEPTSESLPVGTYFWVLNLGNGSANTSGFVYLNK